uniref:Zinc finger, CCHC-type n=1 Tax=Tanacetum cinerariifolium TaxID=118510 RepID=A0A6L2MR29_TANCI|nr:zinc finger, CCHC-type [Tanacetum cinerariifolium]
MRSNNKAAMYNVDESICSFAKVSMAVALAKKWRMFKDIFQEVYVQNWKDKFEQHSIWLWRVKMRALLIQHGCEADLEVLPAYMEAEAKAELNKKAHSAVILCLGNKALREVTGEMTAAGVWSKLENLYMTTSLANKLYLKKKLYINYMPPGQKISEHIDEFNIIVLDLANIKEIKERSKANGDNCEGLYVRGITDHRDSHQSRGMSRSKFRGGRLKCYICQSEDHLKRNSPKNNRKKSTGYIKKDDQPSFIGLIYDSFEVMMSISAEALLDWIINLGSSYHLKPMLDLFLIFEECDGGRVRLGDNRECKIRGIGKSGKVKVINGSSVVLSGTRKENCVYSSDGYVVGSELNASFKEKHSLAQVWRKILGHIREAGLQVLENEELFGMEESRHTTQGLIDYVHSDLYGPSQVKSLGGKKYFLSIVDDCSRRNELAEWMNRTLMDKLRCLLIQYGFPKTFWAEATWLNNCTLEEDLTDQEDGNDEDVGDQKTDQTPDLIDYQLVRDKETRTRIKPLMFQDKSNMAAYAFAAIEEEDTHEPLTYQEAVAWEDNHPVGKKLVSCKRLFKIKEGIQVQHTSIRVILALTECKDYELEQLVVNTKFLHGNLEEVIYMRQPHEYEKDDMMIDCKSKDEIGSTQSLLKNKFDMKELEKAKKILGMEIFRDRSRKIRRVSQSGMSKVSYANVVGSLMYLMVYMRPDIAYAVSVVSRYLANSGKTQSEAVKWILKYLRGTTNVRLVYGTDPGNHVDVTEYMALTEAVKEVIWLRGLLEELGVKLNNVARGLGSKDG